MRCDKVLPVVQVVPVYETREEYLALVRQWNATLQTHRWLKWARSKINKLESIEVDESCAEFVLNDIEIGNRSQLDHRFGTVPVPCSRITSPMTLSVQVCQPYMDYVLIVSNNGREPRPFKAKVHGQTVEIVKPTGRGASSAMVEGTAAV